MTNTIHLPADDREVIIAALRNYRFSAYIKEDAKRRCEKLDGLLAGADIDIHKMSEPKQ